MKASELIAKIKTNEFVQLKVSYRARGLASLEICDWGGSLIHDETFAGDECIQRAQITMLKMAGEYRNKGVAVIIDPFTS